VGSASFARAGSATTLANGFSTVLGFASAGGTDTATITGTTGSDTFWGRETYAKMKDAAGTAYYHYAQDFDQVTANGGGGDDTAYLYGSSGNDTFNLSRG
jgi:hypothetical protein